MPGTCPSNQNAQPGQPALLPHSAVRPAYRTFEMISQLTPTTLVLNPHSADPLPHSACPHRHVEQDIPARLRRGHGTCPVVARCRRVLRTRLGPRVCLLPSIVVSNRQPSSVGPLHVFVVRPLPVVRHVRPSAIEHPQRVIAARFARLPTRARRLRRRPDKSTHPPKPTHPPTPTH